MTGRVVMQALRECLSGRGSQGLARVLQRRKYRRLAASFSSGAYGMTAVYTAKTPETRA